MDGQDWNPVVLHNKNVAASAAARQIVQNGGRVSNEAHRLAKLASATEPPKIKYFSQESVAAVQAYRRENKLTQKQLDQMMSFPPNTMNRLEGKVASPSTGQLNALNRVLKTGLTLE